MAYSINPCLVKARKTALLMLLDEQLPVNVVARKCGVHRTTIWRWYQKWLELNKHISQVHYGRPNRKTQFQAGYYRWNIKTVSSAPKTHPRRIKQWVIDRILAVRKRLGRCAVIIQAELLKEQLVVSLSTIRRVIARYGLQKTKKRHFKRTLPRPVVNNPGDLVEIDTVHYVNQLTGERRYVFTVIDLYSRMTYARCFDRMLPGNALATVLAAEQALGFKFQTVQTDNGPEFSRWFKARIESADRIHRHTRIHSPNDNAHIERFNRTLREECLGHHMKTSYTLRTINQKLLIYLDYYNNHRLHLSLECKAPATVYQEWLRRL